MYKEENLKGEVLELNNICESLEIKNMNEFVGALLNYSDYENHVINKDELNYSFNSIGTWKSIAEALSGLLYLDYTPKGNLQVYADEIYELAKYRVENKIMPENDFTIPELITEVEEKIKTFTKLLLKLKCLNPKTIEETAKSFIEKGEGEYQKIMNETAEKVLNAMPSEFKRVIPE